jgi:FmdE, Molybdenum formylmethanofuran dehydrogenase operon
VIWVGEGLSSIKVLPMKIRVWVLAFAVATCVAIPSNAETPGEWIALGARVHGAFGAFIPLGIKIGLDAVNRLNAKPRELTVLYYDSDASPCACFADGIAIATYASVGQRTLTIAPAKAPREPLRSLSSAHVRVARASNTRSR